MFRLIQQTFFKIYVMKIYTFIFPSADMLDDGKNVPTTKHLVAKDFSDAISVATEKGLSGFVQISEGPEVVAVAGMFE